jgi:hypothetical protein
VGRGHLGRHAGAPLVLDRHPGRQPHAVLNDRQTPDRPPTFAAATTASTSRAPP